jgi:hypothetical protein
MDTNGPIYYSSYKSLLITGNIYIYQVEVMKTLHHKDEFKAVTSKIENNLDFIANNVIYPEPHLSDQKKDVSLNKIMTHLGGTSGEIARLSYIWMKRNERMQEEK